MVILYIGSFINVFIPASLMIFGIHMMLQLKQHNAPLTNATGSTLFFGILSTPFLIMWTAYYLYYPMQGSSIGINTVSLKIGIPGSAVFAAVSFMNLALMWIQVAQSSKSLKKTGSNLGKKPLIMVVTFSILFGLIELICFAIINNNTIGSAVALLFMIAIMVTYLVGSKSLANAIEIGRKPGQKRSPRIVAIINTGRRVAYCLIGFIVFNLMYAAVFTIGDLGVGTDIKAGSEAIKVLHVLSLIFLILFINLGMMVEFKYLRDTTAKSRGRAVTPGGTSSSSTVANTTQVSTQ